MTAVIYRGPQRGIKLDDNDVLMLARAFVGEAGEDVTREEASALFHCWMDRLHLVNARWSQEGWPLSKLIMYHSQPMSPLWIDPDSSKCKARPTDCTPSHIARRKRIQSLSVSQLQQYGAYQLALEAQAGTLGRVVAEPTYDFASCKRVKGINIGGNCFQTYAFLSASKQKSVIPGEVTVDMPAVEVASSGGKVLLVLLGGYALFRLGEYLYEKIYKK